MGLGLSLLLSFDFVQIFLDGLQHEKVERPPFFLRDFLEALQQLLMAFLFGDIDRELPGRLAVDPSHRVTSLYSS